MGDVGADEIRQFLQRLAERYTEPVNLYLIGGGALCLLLKFCAKIGGYQRRP